MRGQHFFWIPSALLAWPIGWYFHPSGFVGSPSTNIAAMAWAGALPTVVLMLLFMAFYRVHRSAAEMAVHSRLTRWLSHATNLQIAWLVVQPIVLAMVHWPEFVTCYLYPSFGWTGVLLGALLPTTIFTIVIRGAAARRELMSNLPVVCALLMAAIVESITFFIAPQELRQSEGWAWVEASGDAWLLALVLVGAGAITSMLLPWWMTWVTGAEQMDPTTTARIEAIWERLGMRSPQVLLWPTACRFSNAALVGSLGRRRLFITDRLLLNYSDEEVELIVLHEAAHCYRKHFLLRILPAFLAVPAMLCCMKYLSGMALIAGCGTVAVLFVLLIIATCWWTELDADRIAIRMAEEHLEFDRVDAKRSYVAMLRRIYRDNRMERTSWSHPSVEQRVAPYLS